MCGIAGILPSPNSRIGDLGELIAAMTAALRRRGPDAQRVWVDDGIALGHRRLAIVDLSDAGIQPMHSACGRFVIVFNGEIYNHQEMRRTLDADGKNRPWRGHSDTETLLAAIVQWGLSGALTRASGMFALALWDRETRQLQLARDRMGEKPLYWGWCGEDFVFASELKALRHHPAFPRQVCRDALALYLQFCYVPAPRSIHSEIFKLEPGCILRIDGCPPFVAPRKPLRPGDTYGSLAISRYWSLADVTDEGRRAQFTSEQDAINEIEAELKAAVSSQMVADVPLGAFLSGGIDSSLIVSLMQTQSSRPVKTFTVGFQDPSFNEAPFAAAVAKHLGTDHTEVLLTERDALDVIPKLPELYDEPFADSSQIATHLVSRIARTEVTVALSGDGGDELFGGYNRYFWGPRIWSRLAWMPLKARRALGYAISTVPVAAWDKVGGMLPEPLATTRTGDKAHKLASRLRDVVKQDDLYRSLVSEWKATELIPGLGRDPDSVLDDPMPGSLGDDPVGRMMFQDMRSYLPDDILCKVDRAAMGVSLETRVPFLDRDVVASAARLPAEMKIRDGRGKLILRNILYRHVPQQLIERPKAGFGVPIGHWLRGPLKDWAEALLSSASLGRDDLLDPHPIRRAWSEHLSGHRDWTTKLWIVLMFLAWRESMESAETAIRQT
jgi:asparagine synthase (glutamine-hydrolysing)